MACPSRAPSAWVLQRSVVETISRPVNGAVPEAVKEESMSLFWSVCAGSENLHGMA